MKGFTPSDMASGCQSKAGREEAAAMTLFTMKLANEIDSASCFTWYLYESR